MVNDEQRFYWMQMPYNFFRTLRMKRLRKAPGGDTCLIIYIEMMIMSLEHKGILFYEGLEDSFESEIALALDEDEDSVRCTVAYLEKVGLLEWNADGECLMKDVPEMISSKKASSIKRQKQRVAKKNQSLLCQNDDQVATMSQNCRTDIEIDLDIEKELEKDSEIDLEKEMKQKDESVYVSLILKDQSEYPVTKEQILEYKDAYPGVDVEQELKRMKMWCDANEMKRKTKNGIKKFIVNWLNNASERSEKPKSEVDYYADTLEKIEGGM